MDAKHDSIHLMCVCVCCSCSPTLANLTSVSLYLSMYTSSISRHEAYFLPQIIASMH